MTDLFSDFTLGTITTDAEPQKVINNFFKHWVSGTKWRWFWATHNYSSDKPPPPFEKSGTNGGESPKTKSRTIILGFR